MRAYGETTNGYPDFVMRSRLACVDGMVGSEFWKRARSWYGPIKESAPVVELVSDALIAGVDPG